MEKKNDMGVDKSILFDNNLVYSAPQASSVTTMRVLRRQLFQNRTYGSNSTATCVWNTGTDFVDAVNSSLVVKISTTGAVADTAYSCGFGTGSAMNIVKNIRIFHTSGTTFTNTQGMNFFRKVEDVFSETPIWFETIGVNMGYPVNDAEKKAKFNDSEESAYFVIPLTKLHPFFQSEGGTFIPSHIASGLRIEIDTATVGESLLTDTTQATNVGNYTVDEIYFNLMSINLMDSAQASLNTTASTKTLDYIYKDIFTSQNTQPSTSTAINIDINRSVGLADHAFATIRPQSILNSVLYDSFESEYYPARYWFLLGSNPFPIQYVDPDASSAYSNALITYDKFRPAYNQGGSATKQIFSVSNSVMAVSLERDCSIALSQSPVNSSRALRFEAYLDNSTGFAGIVTVYMVYVCSLRASLLSAKVDI